MTTVIRALLASPLADRYRLELVETHTGPGARRRLAVFAAAVARLTWWSLRGRGRIVHIHATVRGSLYRKAVCVLVAKALRRRVILHMHSGPGDIASMRERLGGLSVRLFQWTFRLADVVLAVSAASAAALEQAYGVGNVLVVPNAAPEGPMTYEREYGEVANLLYLGGFANPVKGGSNLLEALCQPSLSDMRAVLAGPGEPPEGIDALNAAGPAIQWRGWLDEAARDELLQDSGIFVLPSSSEGLPMALLEAMAYALPIVATTVGGVPDVLTDGSEALLVPPGDPKRLADALGKVAADPVLRERLGTGARERARRLNAEEITTLQVLYEQLLR
jgi:glycosyltransferase involved in cell wall biosynthesis